MEIEVIYLPEAYDFLKSISETARKKVLFNVKKVRFGVKDSNIFKKLNNTDIWEFRTLHGGNYYRLFSFWDNQTKSLIVATHGIVKKSSKTPKKEVVKADLARKNYFDNK
jgi:phage-related protein